MYALHKNVHALHEMEYYLHQHVHYKVFQNIVDSDADFIRDLVNNKLLPFMQKHGIAVGDYTFEWDEAVEYTPQEMQHMPSFI